MINQLIRLDVCSW